MGPKCCWYLPDCKHIVCIHMFDTGYSDTARQGKKAYSQENLLANGPRVPRNTQTMETTDCSWHFAFCTCSACVCFGSLNSFVGLCCFNRCRRLAFHYICPIFHYWCHTLRSVSGSYVNGTLSVVVWTG